MVTTGAHFEQRSRDEVRKGEGGREIEEKREGGRKREAGRLREWKTGTFNFAVSQAIHTITFC